MNHKLSTTLVSWDWMVIGFYFVFIIGIGFLFKHVNKNSSDYFRGGGNMLWWMAGVSVAAATISTWTFTGAAAKVYQSGFLYPLGAFTGSLLSVIVLWYLAPRFRQMRVITSIEAVFRRFGFGTEQFYVYLVLPMGLFWGGIGLNTVAVFMSAAMGINMQLTLIGLGAIVTVMSIFGGQWAVAASDFVQGILMLLIVLVVVYFTMQLPEVGGVGNFIEFLPDRHFDFTLGSRMGIVAIWFAMAQLIRFFGHINMYGEGAKYLQVKDAREARKMVILKLFLFVIIPVNAIMLLPAMCAANIYPNMAEIFPHMKIPEEGAFLVMAFRTLPQGLMGLLICGMFAAAMSTMDTGLNRNAGFFVRNIYIKYLNREASESKQLSAGKLFTLIFGLITIIIGLGVDYFRTMNMFNVMQILSSMVSLPSIIPMALATVYKRTPGWSGWSSVLVGLCTGALAKILYSPELYQKIMNFSEPLNKQESGDAQFIFISVSVTVITIIWFFATSFFYKKSSEEHKERVESLFKDMRTPIDHAKEDVRNQDAMQYRLVGIMCLIFGGGTTLGIFIPNPLYGRIAFLFIGGTILILGIILYSISVKKLKEQPNSEL